jgi:hypothetical protein
MLRHSEPPRILGEMTMFLERVRRLRADTEVLTLFRDGIDQNLYQGDILRLCRAQSARPVAALEVLQDARMPEGADPKQRIHVVVRRLTGPEGTDLLAEMDPSVGEGFPRRPGPQRDAFLRQHGPRLVLVTTYDPRRGDRAYNFVRFTAGGDKSRRDHRVVPPMAACMIRFSKPMDLASLRSLDTVFFSRHEPGAAQHLVGSRLFEVDTGGTCFRIQPVLGFPLTQAMRAAILADRDKPPTDRRHQYCLNLLGGKDGIRDRWGQPLADGMRMGFSLDPEAANNNVGYRVIRLGKGR